MLYCPHLPPGGWVHSVSFSGDGGRVCWVGHDSSLTVADASREMAKSQLKTEYLPFTAVTWVSQNNLVAVVGVLFFFGVTHSWDHIFKLSLVHLHAFTSSLSLLLLYHVRQSFALSLTQKICSFTFLFAYYSPPYLFALNLINHVHHDILVFFSQGHGCCPMLYSVDDSGKLTFVTKLDAAQRKESGSLTSVPAFLIVYYFIANSICSEGFMTTFFHALFEIYVSSDYIFTWV